MAFLSVVGADDRCFLHETGLGMSGTPRTLSLCAFTVAKKQTIAIPDTLLDASTAQHPIVQGFLKLRYYVSAPVILKSGFCIGALCAAGQLGFKFEVRRLN